MFALRPLRWHPSRCSRVAYRVQRSASTAARSLHSSARRPQDAFKSCLECNKKWADDTAKQQPEYFTTLAKGQAPEILWIGCSDSRVPETTVLGLQPGDVFVHRNIANVVNPADLSLQSVVEFSVAHLKVKHIVLCGHTSCGGVNGTLGNGKLGVLDIWLAPMRALREEHAEELAKLEGADKGNYLAKVNVQAGVEKLRRMPPVLEAMRDRGLQVHGAIFDLASGRVQDLGFDEDTKVAEKRLAHFELK